MPYRLKHVTRGYWGTKPAEHKTGVNVDKLQVPVTWGYEGLIPNLDLQDEIAHTYADICKNSGLGMYDFDGQGNFTKQKKGLSFTAKSNRKTYNYEKEFYSVGVEGFEPPTLCL